MSCEKCAEVAAAVSEAQAEVERLRSLVDTMRLWIVNCVDPAAVGVEVKQAMLALDPDAVAAEVEKRRALLAPSPAATTGEAAEQPTGESAEGAWRHERNGTICREQFPLGHRFGSPEFTADGGLWWCTTHVSQIRWHPAPAATTGEAPVYEYPKPSSASMSTLPTRPAPVSSASAAAATTPEACGPFCDHDTRGDKHCDSNRPAPVSSGEAATVDKGFCQHGWRTMYPERCPACHPAPVVTPSAEGGGS